MQDLKAALITQFLLQEWLIVGCSKEKNDERLKNEREKKELSEEQAREAEEREKEKEEMLKKCVKSKASLEEAEQSYKKKRG